MTNKILVTQDIPGERDWLFNYFPNHKNLESVFSGKWTSTFPVSGNKNIIYEVPSCDLQNELDLLKFDLPKYKSVYSTDDNLLFHGGSWTFCDNFVHDLQFKNVKKSDNFIILTMARAGTMFIRSLLIKKINEFQDHVVVSDNENNLRIKNIILENKLTVFCCYRENIWEWIISNILGHSFGFHHYNSKGIDSVYNKKIIATESDLKKLVYMQIASWNFWCNLKCSIPDLNLYLLEFTDMVTKYSKYTDHTNIPYDKSTLIENYVDLLDIYTTKYKAMLENIVNNGIKHLTAMKCKTDIEDLNLIEKNRFEVINVLC